MTTPNIEDLSLGMKKYTDNLFKNKASMPKQRIMLDVAEVLSKHSFGLGAICETDTASKQDLIAKLMGQLDPSSDETKHNHFGEALVSILSLHFLHEHNNDSDFLVDLLKKLGVDKVLADLNDHEPNKNKDYVINSYALLTDQKAATKAQMKQSKNADNEPTKISITKEQLDGVCKDLRHYITGSDFAASYDKILLDYAKVLAKHRIDITFFTEDSHSIPSTIVETLYKDVKKSPHLNLIRDTLPEFISGHFIYSSDLNQKSKLKTGVSPKGLVSILETLDVKSIENGISLTQRQIHNIYKLANGSLSLDPLSYQGMLQRKNSHKM